MGFAAEVRAEMGRQGITGAELANRSNLSRPTITRKITQGAGDLSLEQMESVSRALNVPVWELMRRAEENAQEVAA